MMRRQSSFAVSMGLLLLGVIWLSACKKQPSHPVPLARQGVLDLSQWSFARNGPIELRGEWLFWWQKMVGIQDRGAVKPDGVFSIPGLWQDQQEPGLSSARKS